MVSLGCPISGRSAILSRGKQTDAYHVGKIMGVHDAGPIPKTSARNSGY